MATFQRSASTHLQGNWLHGGGSRWQYGQLLVIGAIRGLFMAEFDVSEIFCCADLAYGDDATIEGLDGVP